MEIKVMPRQSGKTTMFAELLKKDKNSVLVVASEALKQDFIRIHKTTRVVTASQIRNHPQILRGRGKVYIDEVGWVLRHLLDADIILGTHTNIED